MSQCGIETQSGVERVMSSFLMRRLDARLPNSQKMEAPLRGRVLNSHISES